MGTEGVDLLALPFGAYWLLRAVTEKGQALAAEEWKPASPEDCALAEEPVRQVAERLAQRAVPGAGARPLEQRFDSPLWREVARRCLGCSICAYVCPSCSCFDVHHEGNAWGGREIRSWDACTYTRFTLHASGHDPRGTRDARYRQRVLHKFAYVAPDADEEPSRCVGCGRCIAQCPVGIDIHEAMARVLAASREGDTDGRA